MDLDDWGTLLTVITLLNLIATLGALSMITAHRKVTEGVGHTHTSRRTTGTTL